jgi:hypothetical protein
MVGTYSQFFWSNTAGALEASAALAGTPLSITTTLANSPLLPTTK